MAIPHQNAMVFGRFRLDRDTESVWRDTEEIRLRPKAFAVLRYLAERPRRVVTKDELLDAVWAGVAVGEAALAVCVGEIRKRLDDDARSPRLIETVHRRGYRFIGSTASAASVEPVSDRPRTNISHQLTSFIGRHTEMQITWLARLDSEHDNLRSALGWSLGQPDHAQAGLRLADALQWFWFMRGPVDEGRQWLERAVSSAPEPGGGVRARALAGLGMLAWRAGDFVRARTALEESLALARALADESTMGLGLHHLAHVHVMQVEGDFFKAAEMWEESIARFRSSGERWGIAWSLFCLGDNARGHESLPYVTARLDESLTLFREIGDRWLIAYVLSSLGAIAREQGDYARANALLEESLAIWRETGSNHAIAIGYRELGHVARCQSLHDRAASLYRASLDRLRDQGERYETAWVLEGLATLALAEGRPLEAARILGTAETLRLAIGAAINPVDRAAHDRTAAAIRAALGDRLFGAAFAEGGALSVDEAMTLVPAGG